MTQIASTTNSLSAIWERIAQLEKAAQQINSQLASFREELQSASSTSSNAVSSNKTPMVTLANPVASAASAQSASASGTEDAASEQTLEEKVRAALTGRMTAAGLDPASLPLTYNEQYVWFPGGGYTNRTISMTTPDGRTDTYDAELTLISPDVTVSEMCSFTRQQAQVS